MDIENVRRILQDGWSNHDRVEGWVDSQMFREFHDPVTKKYWRKTLYEASAACENTGDSTALDIGTGPGTIARFWSEFGYDTTGIDFSPAMLEAGRNIAAEAGLDIEFLHGDAQHPDFPGAAFDVISSRFLIFTLTHPGYAMRRWVRMLKPGGRLVMIGHDHPKNPENRGHHKQKKRRWHASDEYMEALQELPFKNHTSGELRVVMEAAGLQDIRCMPVDDIVAARNELQSTNPELGEFSSVPFVLVGRAMPDVAE